MGSRTLPEGMTWEDCRTCGCLTIVSESSSVYGGTISCCYECMKKSRAEVERLAEDKHAKLVEVADKLRLERERWEASRQALESAYDTWDRNNTSVDMVLVIVRGIISRPCVTPTDPMRHSKGNER